ncbi:cobalamin B12-binding domain-containing protein [Mycolicibacterium sp. XJ879]
MSSDRCVQSASAAVDGLSWQSVPHPVVVVDRSGVVHAVSAPARSVLADVEIGARLADTAPSWLVRAHDRRASVATGTVNGREFEARPTELSGGEVAWWQMDFLGAQVPNPHLVAHLHQHAPDAVALSCSIPTRLPAAHAAIAACQSAGVSVLVGGAAFGADGRYARLLGADAWAPDARGAAQWLSEGLTRLRLSANHHAPGSLPHLADQEYSLVSSTKAQLVKQSLADLQDRFPAMRDYSEAQREHTAADIAHIVDFLATALYVDDDDLFTGFMVWTAEVLCARGVPTISLTLTLELLSAQLQDFPRTQRLLAAARTDLSAYRTTTAS